VVVRQVEVTDVLEEDTEDGVPIAKFGGTVMSTTERVSFHVRGEPARQMARLVRDGEAVHVELDDPKGG
jgi:hypothetical protein